MPSRLLLTMLSFTPDDMILMGVIAFAAGLFIAACHCLGTW